MDELRYLLKDVDLKKVNWVSFFRSNSTLINSVKVEERESFIRQYKEEIGLSFAFTEEICNVSKNFIREYMSEDKDVNSTIATLFKLDNVDEFLSYISDWNKMFPLLSSLDEKVLERYKEDIDWSYLLEEKVFSNEFLVKNLDYFLWLSKKNKKLNVWKTLSYFQRLDDTFIEMYEKKLDWELMSSSQCFSEKIMLKYFDKIKWEFALDNKNIIIPYSVERELKTKLNYEF